MPSHLRLQSSLEEPISANAIYHTAAALPPAKKQKMSLTQTYYIASTARSKLGREASKADHNLRRLVGSANLLDTLMEQLADAEREQEAWFNQSVRKASKTEEPRHIQWVDTIPEDDEQSDDESDADSEYDEDEAMFDIPLRKIKSPPVTLASADLEDDEDDDMDAEYEEVDDEEDEYALRRVPSNRHSPPELTHDEESDSEDEDTTPASPENIAFELSEKERQAITTTTFYDNKTLQDYAVQEPQQPLIAAC